MTYDLVIMAGGTLDPVKWGEGCPESKALLKFGKHTMLDITLRAFRGVRGINRRVVVGDAKGIPEIARTYHALSIRCGFDLAGNLKNVLHELSHSSATHLIIATSDIPFFSSEAAFNLVAIFNKLKDEFDFVYPVVPVDFCKAMAPKMKRTSIRTVEGRFTGGNVFMMDRKKLEANIKLLESVIRERKNPIKLARIFGLGTVFSVIAGTGTLDKFAQQLNRKVVGKVTAHVSHFAEIAIDVDSPEQYNALTSIQASS